MSATRSLHRWKNLKIGKSMDPQSHDQLEESTMSSQRLHHSEDTALTPRLTARTYKIKKDDPGDYDDTQEYPHAQPRRKNEMSSDEDEPRYNTLLRPGSHMKRNNREVPRRSYNQILKGLNARRIAKRKNEKWEDKEKSDGSMLRNMKTNGNNSDGEEKEISQESRLRKLLKRRNIGDSDIEDTGPSQIRNMRGILKRKNNGEYSNLMLEETTATAGPEIDTDSSYELVSYSDSSEFNDSTTSPIATVHAVRARLTAKKNAMLAASPRTTTIHYSQPISLSPVRASSTIPVSPVRQRFVASTVDDNSPRQASKISRALPVSPTRERIEATLNQEKKRDINLSQRIGARGEKYRSPPDALDDMKVNDVTNSNRGNEITDTRYDTTSRKITSTSKMLLDTRQRREYRSGTISTEHNIYGKLDIHKMDWNYAYRGLQENNATASHQKSNDDKLLHDKKRSSDSPLSHHLAHTEESEDKKDNDMKASIVEMTFAQRVMENKREMGVRSTRKIDMKSKTTVCRKDEKLNDYHDHFDKKIKDIWEESTTARGDIHPSPRSQNDDSSVSPTCEKDEPTQNRQSTPRGWSTISPSKRKIRQIPMTPNREIIPPDEEMPRIEFFDEKIKTPMIKEKETSSIPEQPELEDVSGETSTESTFFFKERSTDSANSSHYDVRSAIDPPYRTTEEEHHDLRDPIFHDSRNILNAKPFQHFQQYFRSTTECEERSTLTGDDTKPTIIGRRSIIHPGTIDFLDMQPFSHADSSTHSRCGTFRDSNYSIDRGASMNFSSVHDDQSIIDSHRSASHTLLSLNYTVPTDDGQSRMEQSPSTTEQYTRGDISQHDLEYSEQSPSTKENYSTSDLTHHDSLDSDENTSDPFLFCNSTSSVRKINKHSDSISKKDVLSAPHSHQHGELSSPIQFHDDSALHTHKRGDLSSPMQHHMDNASDTYQNEALSSQQHFDISSDGDCHTNSITHPRDDEKSSGRVLPPDGQQSIGEKVTFLGESVDSDELCSESSQSWDERTIREDGINRGGQDNAPERKRSHHKIETHADFVNQTERHSSNHRTQYYFLDEKMCDSSVDQRDAGGESLEPSFVSKKYEAQQDGRKLAAMYLGGGSLNEELSSEKHYRGGPLRAHRHQKFSPMKEPLNEKFSSDANSVEWFQQKTLYTIRCEEPLDEKSSSPISSSSSSALYPGISSLSSDGSILHHDSFTRSSSHHQKLEDGPTRHERSADTVSWDNCNISHDTLNHGKMSMDEHLEHDTQEIWQNHSSSQKSPVTNDRLQEIVTNNETISAPVQSVMIESPPVQQSMRFHQTQASDILVNLQPTQQSNNLSDDFTCANEDQSEEHKLSQHIHQGINNAWNELYHLEMDTVRRHVKQIEVLLVEEYGVTAET